MQSKDRFLKNHPSSFRLRQASADESAFILRIHESRMKDER
jgi:hypothetical protein